MYFLVPNMIYNCKHIIQERWWHKAFGAPSGAIDYVEAKSHEVAEKKFRLKGHNFGMFH